MTDEFDYIIHESSSYSKGSANHSAAVVPCQKRTDKIAVTLTFFEASSPQLACFPAASTVVVVVEIVAGATTEHEIVGARHIV